MAGLSIQFDIIILKYMIISLIKYLAVFMYVLFFSERRFIRSCQVF